MLTPLKPQGDRPEDWERYKSDLQRKQTRPEEWGFAPPHSTADPTGLPQTTATERLKATPGGSTRSGGGAQKKPRQKVTGWTPRE
ncbi:MAG: hypothetical protein OEW12_06245 [Deltaproteobacteria bacterium]|nr:hypothetical protein [Deltaproteobacteria bacterium]